MSRYAVVPRPRAYVDSRSVPARAYLGRLAVDALRHGLPARRRGGRAWARLARRPPPARALAALVRAAPRRSIPELDGLLAAIGDAWPALAERSERLPAARPDDLTALALPRSAALTAFVFGDGPDPLVVAKLPRLGSEAPGREAALLERVAPARVAPRFLGGAGGAFVQEALSGRPLPLVPLDPRTAGSLAWSPAHAELAAGLVRLAEVTARPGRPSVASTQGLEVNVVEHYDLSPQNCLVEGARLSGLVDWEHAREPGTPGFDVWDAALSYVEHAAGLVAWDDEHLLAVFENGWRSSPFWAEARAAARAAAGAAGVSDDLHDALEVAYFAERVAARRDCPEDFPTSAALAARMLSVVA